MLPVSSDIESLTDEVKDANRFKLAESVQSAVQGMTADGSKEKGAATCEEPFRKKWVSPLDEVSGLDMRWDDLDIGGRGFNTSSVFKDARSCDNHLQFAPHDKENKRSNACSVFKDVGNSAKNGEHQLCCDAK